MTNRSVLTFVLSAAVLLALPVRAYDASLAISDPEILSALETDGVRLGAVLFGANDDAASALKAHRGYRDLVGILERDLLELTSSDRLAGVGMSKSHRAFDARWFTSPVMRYELVAVVSRPDRSAFHPGTCGETRLIFRLAYSGNRGDVVLSSRVPMTVNVVYFVNGEDCSTEARRWKAASMSRESARLLRGEQGPLNATRLTRKQLKSVEVNLQSVRWPSTVRPDLGGHAEYLLRAFKPEGADRLRPMRLENTPDVAKLKSDANARRALLTWLKGPETIAMIDEGTAILPERFLAERSVSVAPHGLARLQNRPFAQLFSPTDFEDAALKSHPRLVTARGLLRRLDGLSCAGCHQSRSIAGFHVVGEEPAGAPGALAVPFSQHMFQDLDRRSAHVAALLEGSDPDERRPHPERGAGAWGEACGLGDPAFAKWTCASGLACLDVGDRELGACQSPAAPQIGDACEVGKITRVANGRRDALERPVRTSCGDERVCEASRVGFPSGMCAGSCGSLSEEATCGAIALLTPFNECLARGRPFTECATLARPAALRSCDASHGCREDYICARTSTGRGACLPPYFLLQLRLDGHVLPTATLRQTAR